MDANLGSMSTYMRTDGFPNDVLSNINPLTLIIFIPIVDKWLYPGLRKIGFKMRPITRITIGFWIGVVAMAYCAIIQVPPRGIILIIALLEQIRSVL
jgi:POT family proton-dependent oligopeptide transporter